MPASARPCPSAGTAASKLDTRTEPGPRGSEASNFGTASGVLEEVPLSPCLSWRRWYCPAAPLDPHAQQSGRFYREAARLTCSPSRGLGTFPKADLCEEPSQGLQGSRGSFLLQPGAFPGHSACPAPPGPTGLEDAGHPPPPGARSRERRPAQGPAKCRWPRNGAGCERSELALGRFFKSIQSLTWLYMTLT